MWRGDRGSHKIKFMSDRTFILLGELGAIALKYQQRMREIREGRREKVSGIG